MAVRTGAGRILDTELHAEVEKSYLAVSKQAQLSLPLCQLLQLVLSPTCSRLVSKPHS